MSKIERIKRYSLIHLSIIIFVWVVIYAIPLLFGNFPKDNDWQAVYEVWVDDSYLLLLFLINHFVLLPQLFFKKRRLFYFVVATLMVSAFFSIIFVSYMHRKPEQPEMGTEFNPHGQPFSPNAERPRPDGAFDPNSQMGEQPNSPQRTERDERQVHARQHPGMMPAPGGMKEPLVPPYANLLILAILLLGFDTGLSISMKWVMDEQKRIELEKENTENKLTFLRQQVSPHFFMNTLNNIHALIDINQEQAKESVIKLSKLMNYLIYDTQDGMVKLKDELAFIESYIELMQLRFSDKVTLDFHISTPVPQVEIAPLLFISFIENAFKYGISYQSPSFVKMVFDFKDGQLFFAIDNSLHPKKEKREKSGFGIENTRKRLELLYNKDYNLDLIETTERFTVKLILPL